MYYEDMRNFMKYDEPAEELIVTMRTYGFTVTRPELARWHRAGLLPQPERRSLGRGRGMVSVYPPGTANQLHALCLFHRSERRLPYVAWCLWWAGYDVSIDSARQFLEQATTIWHQEIGKLKELQEHSDVLLEQIERMRIMRLSSKALAQARKRIGRKHFPTFIGILVRVVLGTFEGYAIDPNTGTDAYERTIVEKGFGLRRARTEWVGGAKPWLTGDISEAFKMCSSLLRDHPPGKGLKTARNADLLRARDEVRRFLTFMESISATLDELLGQGALGLSVFATLIREMRPRDQALMLLFWVMFRSWGLGEGMDLLLELAHQWHQVWLPIFQGLEHLREEVPATAAVLAPKPMGDALHRPAAMEHALNLAQHLAQQYAPELQAFFAHHPELSQVIEAGATAINPQG